MSPFLWQHENIPFEDKIASIKVVSSYNRKQNVTMLKLYSLVNLFTEQLMLCTY